MGMEFHAMPTRKIPGEVKPVAERASTAGFAIAGGQTELVERLSKVLEELRAAGGVVVGGPNVADWSQDGGWFRDLNDGWSQAGGWVRTNDRDPGAVVRPPEVAHLDPAHGLHEPVLDRDIGRDIGRAVGRVVVKKPTDGG
jgi:hypothetical protein